MLSDKSENFEDTYKFVDKQVDNALCARDMVM